MQFTFNLTSASQLKAALPHLAQLLKIEREGGAQVDRSVTLNCAPEEIEQRMADAARDSWEAANDAGRRAPG